MGGEGVVARAGLLVVVEKEGGGAGAGAVKMQLDGTERVQILSLKSRCVQNTCAQKERGERRRRREKRGRGESARKRERGV